MNDWHLPDAKLNTARNVAIVKTAPAYLLLVPQKLPTETGKDLVSPHEYTWHTVGIGDEELGVFWPPLLELLAATLRQRYGADGPTPEAEDR